MTLNFSIRTLVKPNVVSASLPVFLENHLMSTEDNLKEFLTGAAVVRYIVFVDEQNCNPENEMDKKDSESVHFSVIKEEKAVATCRIFEYEPSVWKLGRLAVLKEYRGQKLGQLLMKEAEEYVINKEKGKRILLNAQKDKAGFYAKMGYVHDESAGEWMEENMVHIKMCKDL